MKINEISEKIKEIFKTTAKNLGGASRREYIATITIELLDGNARKAESIFGWGRETVKKGMNEVTTGVKYKDNYSARGSKKTEEKIPQIAEDIREIVEPKSQADPKFQTPFAYTKITAKAVRQALIDEKGYIMMNCPVKIR